MKKIYKVLPQYAIVPLFITIVLTSLTYYVSRLIASGMKHYDFSIGLDDKIPLIIPMILIYVLAYVTWIVGYIVIARESKETCYEMLAGEQISKLISLAFFIIVPTEMVRPEITGTGFFEWLINLIYGMDTPDNLFPSLHCLMNWFVFRGALGCKKVGSGYKVFMFIAAILVFASTVFVKQHLFVDIFGGVIVLEIGLYLSRKFRAKRIYYIIEKKLEKNEK